MLQLYIIRDILRKERELHGFSYLQKYCPVLTDTENNSMVQDQSPDPLEMQIEAPVIIKQEKSEEVLPAPRKRKF